MSFFDELSDDDSVESVLQELSDRFTEVAPVSVQVGTDAFVLPNIRLMPVRVSMLSSDAAQFFPALGAWLGAELYDRILDLPGEAIETLFERWVAVSNA